MMADVDDGASKLSLSLALNHDLAASAMSDILQCVCGEWERCAEWMIRECSDLFYFSSKKTEEYITSFLSSSK